MYSLSDKQIDFILNDIRARGVEMEDLQLNLLDHICCIIENDLETDGNFEDFYHTTIKKFYKRELWEIEEETINLLIFKNYYVMKKIMIVSGTVSVILMSIGILFKFMHWPGAGVLIVLGIAVSSFIFLPLMFTLKAKEKQKAKDKITLGIATFLGILISLSVLFKVMHWPGANFMGVSFIVLMIGVYIPLYFFSGIKNPDSKVNTIVTSILMVMGCGLFLTLINSRPYIQERSAEVSNSYLQKSYETINAQSEKLFSSIQEDSLRGKEIRELHNRSNELCNHIEKMKLTLVDSTEGVIYDKINYEEFGRLDNYDVPTTLLFTENLSPKGDLAYLKQKLLALNSYCQEAFKFESQTIIDLTDKPNRLADGNSTWEVRHFYRTPVMNVLRNLTVLQMNIRFVEANCIR
ncbi:MAG: hypothetical protein K0S12_656 [Bacteroidetes bacterium]|jgi:hypothetical protein|nr:hypothetical protein [Bacteroidota bacterium]